MTDLKIGNGVSWHGNHHYTLIDSVGESITKLRADAYNRILAFKANHLDLELEGLSKIVCCDHPS